LPRHPQTDPPRLQQAPLGWYLTTVPRSFANLPAERPPLSVFGRNEKNLIANVPSGSDAFTPTAHDVCCFAQVRISKYRLSCSRHVVQTINQAQAPCSSRCAGSAFGYLRGAVKLTVIMCQPSK
jgi:hypothetical protein